MIQLKTHLKMLFSKKSNLVKILTSLQMELVLNNLRSSNNKQTIEMDTERGCQQVQNKKFETTIIEKIRNLDKDSINS